MRNQGATDQLAPSERLSPVPVPHGGLPGHRGRLHTWKDFSLDRYLEAFYLYWTFGGVLGLPGMAVWLGFNAVVPVTWSGAWRRAVAIATSPLIQAWWLWAFLSLELVEPAILFGIVLPAGAGSVIRLRGRTPEWSGLLVPVGGRTQRTTP